MSFLDLPNEIRLKIIKQLDVRTKINFFQTCSAFYSIRNLSWLYAAPLEVSTQASPSLDCQLTFLSHLLELVPNTRASCNIDLKRKQSKGQDTFVVEAGGCHPSHMFTAGWEHGERHDDVSAAAILRQFAVCPFEISGIRIDEECCQSEGPFEYITPLCQQFFSASKSCQAVEHACTLLLTSIDGHDSFHLWTCCRGGLRQAFCCFKYGTASIIYKVCSLDLVLCWDHLPQGHNLQVGLYHPLRHIPIRKFSPHVKLLRSQYVEQFAAFVLDCNTFF